MSVPAPPTAETPAEALMLRRMELLEKSFRVADDENKIAVATVRSEVAALREASAGPWYRDRRFWAGIATVPALLLGGWLVKTVSGDAAALRLLHKAFGTEPALSSALRDDASEFTKQLESTIGKGLQSKTGILAGALQDSLKDRHVLTEETLVPTLSKELKEYVGARHAAFQSVGLTDPSRVRVVPCDTKSCLDASAGQTKTATIVFGANPGKNVDIELGINVRQYALTATGKYDPSKSEDVTSRSILSEHLVLRLDEGPALVFVPVPGQMQRYTLDGVTYIFEQFRATSQPIGGQAFPMHSLSIEVPQTVSSDRVIHLAAVISQSN